jgi:hypothetical protein
MTTRPRARVPESLRSSFAAVQRRMESPGTSVEVPLIDRAAEALRFELALRGRSDPVQLLSKPRTPRAGSLFASLSSSERASVLDVVAADCETGRAGERGWVLLDRARRRVLQTATRENVIGALSERPPADGDDVDQTLRWWYLENDRPHLESLSAAQLRSLIAASTWVDRDTLKRYDVDDLRRLLAKRVRQDEYERIVSAGVFGRDKEREWLLAFLQPRATDGPRLEIRHVFGPGGIGKSTLIAAAALSVVTADEEAVLVHLDFDRGDLDPTRSATLDLELLTQAGFSHAQVDTSLHDRRERIRQQLDDELYSGEGARRQHISAEAAASFSKGAVGDALSDLHLLGRPLLIILDTFEQVEAGGDLYVAALHRWLEDIAGLSGAPQVRVLISGRTDPESGPYSDAPSTSDLPVGELDADGAVQLLTSRAVPEPVAARICETFGGNPLLLRLAASLIQRLGPEAIDEIAAQAKEGQLPQEIVQGLLYDRFLKHIDPPGDEFAHPGLVLPEITIDLIKNVLGPVQRNTVLDEATAKDVFDALARATWLVRVSGDALVQRRELRQLLLKLMNSDPQRAESVKAVRARAIEHHSDAGTPSDRAFALYHRLMTVRRKEELGQFEGVDFRELAPTLRQHLDDLPEAARVYVQARLLRTLGAEEALQTLPDEAWKRYIAGDGHEPGEGDRLVQASDPMIALQLWRRRPVRVDDQLPVFVLQALVETGEWEDPARGGALKYLDVMWHDRDFTPRLYWLTALQLLRGKRLSGVHLECLSKVFGGNEAEHIAISAVAEAVMGRQLIPDDALERGEFASETRVYLVHATRFTAPREFRPQLDALLVLQKDWADRIKGRYLSFSRRMLERLRRVVDVTAAAVGAEAPDVPDVTRYLVLEKAQSALDSLAAAPLDTITAALRILRTPVRVTDIAKRPTAGQVLLLRGTTPEFYRPVRQALREALTTPDQIAAFMARLRPAFTICPRDLEPDTFVPRAVRDPVTWFLALVQYADRARVMESLLDAATAEAPDHPKLRRICDAWRKWDLALGNDHPSGWAQSK